MKPFFIFIIAFILLAFIVAFVILWQFRSPLATGEAEQFIVPKGGGFDVVSELEDRGLVRHTWTMRSALILRGISRQIKPGGYLISPAMNPFEIAGIFAGTPQMQWFTVLEGQRKEEIADNLEYKFGWAPEEALAFLSAPEDLGYEIHEGIYFPDTYLVLTTDGGAEVAGRMINRFNEALTELNDDLLAQNIKWTTAVKLASIVEREGIISDMDIVAGILWNRLDIGMKLDVDATVQYSRGNVGQGYWAPSTREDKGIDSPYNTYKVSGLPPGPIANPGLNALRAVIYPAETECLFYIHDANQDIYCAETYDEHLDNINEYLR